MQTLSFPLDYVDTSLMAYAMGMGIVLNTYPDIHTDEKVIKAVAEANFQVGLDSVRTNNLTEFRSAYITPFCLGYKDASKLFNDQPRIYKKLLSLTEDEQIPQLMAMAHGWWKFMQDTVIPNETNIKFSFNKKQKRKR